MRLAAPKGLDVRPTLDRVREALFSIIAPRIEEAAFLDLFAGTGANGIEALSRGAKHATFIDNDARALEAIRHTLEATRLAPQAKVRRLTLPNGLIKLSAADTSYDIIFADPPYDFTEYGLLLSRIRAGSLLAEGGMIIIEHASRHVGSKSVRTCLEIDTDLSGFQCTRRAQYGDTALSFFS